MATTTKTPAQLLALQKKLFTIEKSAESGNDFAQLTDAGYTVAVKLANTLQRSFDPAWVMQHSESAFGKVINYRSPNTRRRLKDTFHVETVDGKTLANAIAGEVVNMLSVNPVSLADDPLADF